jgi:nitrogen fixation/metabolism regulation signal transduction histidine kinase
MSGHRNAGRASTVPRHSGPRRLGYEARIALLGFLIGFPGAALALILLWTGDSTPRTQWTLTVLLLGAWWILAVALRERAVRPIQTLSNLLAALLEGDYSIRSRRPATDDALGLAFREVNALGQTLREQRIGALEATALLRAVMDEIDVAIFAFDAEDRLRLANHAGERLLDRPAEWLQGRTAGELGLAGCLGSQGQPGTQTGDPAGGQGASGRTRDPAPRLVELAFPGGAGRWEARTGDFRQGGLPHRLLVLTDLSRALREEERQAWQRLVRVLGHEINNSLAPIKSIAGSLQSLLAREPRPADLEADLERGLDIVATRADALGRFMNAYARLARLPPPRPATLEVGTWVRRVAALETRLPVTVEPGPDLTIHAAGDQLEQLLINLVRNAADAALETGGGVQVRWQPSARHLELHVDDDGPGLPPSANLFVPFFTTKPQGSGIGLVLSRQIAEAHGGTLTLVDQPDGKGCRAVLRLPAGG